HANGATSTNANSFGGVITIDALAGTFASTGRAVQANATGPGSDGGTVTLQTSGDVTLNTSSIEARGPNGSNTQGGAILVKSFNGQVSGNNAAGSELDAFGGAGGTALGQVTLSACTANPFPFGTYQGTIVPSAVVNFPVCGGAPAPPAAFALHVNCDTIVCGALPGQECIKRGTKFNDVDGDGKPREALEPPLPGWTIRAYLFPT